MRLIVELEDFGYLCDYDEYDGHVLTKDELAQAVLDSIKDAISNSLAYNPHVRNTIADNCVSIILRDYKDEIISSVVKELTESVSKKKAIMDQTPKRKDFQNINKEWEEYFEGLIAKCIAKKFK